MTFYEAAIRVLEAEKRPLTTQEITERSISQGLLSHVGKNPVETLRSRLVVMSRRTRDRRVSVVGDDAFALVEWGLPEDAEALARMSQPEEPLPPEEAAPLRAVERHPESRSEGARAARQERHGRRHEHERGPSRRRLPPLEEVAFEMLSEASEPLAPAALLERAVGRDLASPQASVEQLLTALVTENQRRIDGGRTPHFVLQADGTLAVDRSGIPPAELQAAFAAALALPVEEGRVVLASVKPPEAGAEATLVASARSAVREARRSVARSLRSHLSALDAGTFERACIKMLHGLSFRELKVVKRGRDGPLLTGRRREGSLELRYAIRILKGGGVDRRMVVDCRRDQTHHGAQVGLVLASGDARGEARSEAVAQPALVFLWCGEGLADKFLEAHAGVRVTHAELYELDPAFFQSAARVAAEVRERREERRRERAEHEEGEGEEADAPGASEGTSSGVEASAGVATESAPPRAESDASAERKRRRRRRRGRRGRGPRPGEPGEAQPGAGSASKEGHPPGGDAVASGGPPEPPPAAEPQAAPPGAAGEGSAQ